MVGGNRPSGLKFRSFLYALKLQVPAARQHQRGPVDNGKPLPNSTVKIQYPCVLFKRSNSKLNLLLLLLPWFAFIE